MPAGDDLRRLIGRVRDGDPSAWSAFIDQFAPVILQAVGCIERDRDAAGDAFVFACERLRERNGARLASYDFDRPGTFENWLRAVVMNLARDARRQRLGRLRPMSITQALGSLEQRVFRLRYELGFTFDQVLAVLSPDFPGLTDARLAEVDAAVTKHMTSRHRWMLLTRRPQFESLSAEDDAVPRRALLADGPDPEWQALAAESNAALREALSHLEARDRLLLRLRVERGLTLEVLARMFQFSNPQAVHRRLHDVM